MSIIDMYPGLIEQVRKDGMLPELFNKAPNLVQGLIGEANVETNVNQRFYRIPFKKYRGGNFGKLGLNLGAFGDGNSFVLDNLACGYFAFAQTQALNAEEKVTAQGPNSVVDAFAELMSDATDMMQQQMECILHTSGDGVLTNASSAFGTATFTFDGASDYIGVNRLVEGATVEVWDTGLTTNRGAARIVAINHDAKTATLNAAPGGSTSTDRFVIRDIEEYGPATPTSFASGYPSSGANGVGGDSFIHGLSYYLNTNNANYVLGKQKSAIPQLAPKHIAAGGNPLTYMHGIRIANKIKRSRGMTEKMIALVPVAQTEHLQAINLSLITTDLQGEKFGKVKDLAPDGIELGGEFSFAGVAARSDLRMDEATVYYIVPELWGKVQPQPIDFWNLDGKGPIYRTLNTNGKMTTGLEFHLWGACDYFCIDPGRQAVIDGLSVPADSW